MEQPPSYNQATTGSEQYQLSNTQDTSKQHPQEPYVQGQQPVQQPYNPYPTGGQYPPQGYPPQGYPPQQLGYPPQQIVQQQPGAFAYPSQTTVISAGQPLVYQGSIPDHTVLAWISCLFCFWPTGIVAIIKAGESRRLLAANDTHGAMIASQGAKRFSTMSIILGAIALPFIIIVAVLRVIYLQ